jgi:hypothetical protein
MLLLCGQIDLGEQAGGVAEICFVLSISNRKVNGIASFHLDLARVCRRCVRAFQFVEGGVAAVTINVRIEKRAAIVQHVHIRRGQTEVDARKLGADFVGTVHRRREPNHAVLAATAGFHRDFTGAGHPAIARAKLRLLAGIESDIRIVAGTWTFILERMPEANWSGCVRLSVYAKLIGREGVGRRVPVLPDFIWIVAERKIQGEIEASCRWGQQGKESNDDGEASHINFDNNSS